VLKQLQRGWSRIVAGTCVDPLCMPPKAIAEAETELWA
jgi:hypothetical protein